MKIFLKRRRFTKKRNLMVDEVLFDGENTAGFQMDKLEGSLHTNIDTKILYIIGFILSVIVIIFAVRLYNLQIQKGEQMFILSEKNRLDSIPIFSERGIIYDRNNVELAWNVQESTSDVFYKRAYISKSGFSHILGFVGYPTKDSSGFWWRQETIGRDATERFFDEILKGTNGRQLIEVSATQKISGQNQTIPAISGQNIHLTIDSEIQHYLYEAIKKHADEFLYQGGAGVMMDIETGEIIALTNFPEYDSNIISDGSKADVIQSYFTSQNKPFLNRAISGLYTPGSIIKPFIALAALNENIVTKETKINSTGSITVQNPYNPELSSTFKDWKEGGHGQTNVIKALAESVNTYFYSIGGGYGNQKGLGITAIDSYLEAFEIGKPTGFSFGNEATGTIPSPAWKKEQFNDSWRLGDTYITSIGQFGFLVSPIQIARGVAAIASNGKLVRPIIDKKNDIPEIKDVSIKVLNDHYETVKEGMRSTVTEGTAKTALDIPGTSLAVKTGTAQVGADKKLINSWVVGFFPFEEPKYSFVILMEKGPNKPETRGASWVMRELVLFLKEHNQPFLEGK